MAAEAIDVVPKKEANVINPGAKKKRSFHRIRKYNANAIGKVIPQLNVGGLIKYSKKSFFAI
ncbi:MAG: hypothetical protein ACTSU6_00660 [Candidatus Njordarchaeales archaeon]